MKILDIGRLKWFNEYICDSYGLQSVLVNESNLLSALSVQDNNYYENDNELAAALFRSLIIAHGFLDGNKRTAVIALFYIHPPKVNDSELEKITLNIATGKLQDYKEIAELLF